MFLTARCAQRSTSCVAFFEKSGVYCSPVCHGRRIRRHDPDIGVVQQTQRILKKVALPRGTRSEDQDKRLAAAGPRRDALDCAAHQVRSQSLDHLPLSRVADQPCELVNGEPQ